MPQICDMGQAFYLHSEEDVLRIFFALKNLTASAGFEPANLGTKGQHTFSKPPKPFLVRYYFLSRIFMKTKYIFLIFEMYIKQIFNERGK
jgi:hypothetical protein